MYKFVEGRGAFIFMYSLQPGYIGKLYIFLTYAKPPDVLRYSYEGKKTDCFKSGLVKTGAV